jgi:predicted ferric reductase
MTDAVLDRPGARPRERSGAVRRTWAAYALGLAVAVNAGVITWLWVHGGNVTNLPHTGDVLSSIGRITGLLSAYLALVQVLLLARLQPLDRAFGLDRLTRWHRWNGHVCIDLVVLHVVFIVWGYALLDRISVLHEFDQMLGGGIYPGMITATVGTVLLLAVVATSLVIVRRKLSYEWWYAVHLLAYAGIALSWFHEIPTGNELVLDQTAADYWRSLFVATLAILVIWRLLVPLAQLLRHRLRVLEVREEGPGVVSIVIGGRGLDRLRARGGQFFVWRFLDRHRWWTAHPFSLSALPEPDRLRITVKALGDHTGRLASLKPGTRVLAEGPFGVFTEDVRRCPDAVLVAGGIGITPVRALLEEAEGDVVVLYRAMTEDDLVLRDELEALAAARGATLHLLPGDHRGAGKDLLSPDHLRLLVPDVDRRDVFVCGPAGMADALVRNVRAAGVPRRHVHTERFALV